MEYNYPKTRYCHDYNHCRAIGCEHRDCMLYFAYLEAKELNLKDYKCWEHCSDEYLSYVPVIIHERSEE